MNKAQLVAEVQKSLGADTSKAAAERSIEAVLEGIKKGVKKGQERSTYWLRYFLSNKARGS